LDAIWVISMIFLCRDIGDGGLDFNFPPI